MFSDIIITIKTVDDDMMMNIDSSNDWIRWYEKGLDDTTTTSPSRLSFR